ncbi:MAG: DNA polymerase I [Planctomycetes bacterium]|nr:DNA polymerase I [Planctomycetota bacterium]
MKKLYVIDGHWLIFRAYYAPFRDLHSPSGEPTRATYVFCTTLLKLITQQKPDYLAVTLDSGRELLERTRVYPQYKATRVKLPEDLPPQISRIVEIVQAMKIPILQKVGVEGDDIMATIVRRFANKNMKIFLVSRDKDLEQLIGPNVVLYDPMKDKIIDTEILQKEKGYPPEKAVDVHALCGDTSDNVPGIPGIGPKTAVKLINKYGSLEQVIACADDLTPKLAENIQKYADQARLAKELITLDDDVDIEIDLSAMEFHGIDADSVRVIFEQLGFRRLIDSLDKVADKKRNSQAGQQVLFAGQTTAKDFDYRCIDNVEEFDNLVEQLRKVRYLAVDTETTSPLPMWADLVGLSLAWQPGKAVYIPIAGPLGQKVIPIELLRERIGPILADDRVEKIGHNLKYDMIVLANASIPLAGPMFDTMLAAYVLDASRGNYGIDSLAAEFLNHRCISFAKVAGKGRGRKKMDQIPIAEVAVYAAEDADVALRLSEVFRNRLNQEGLTDLFENIEMALMPVLAQMERNGIRIDPDELNRQRQHLSNEADILREQIIQSAGCQFNPDSPKQLAEVLFEKLKLPVLKHAKTGPSTDVSVLSELAVVHEVPRLVLEYRQITKLLRTYLNSLAEFIHPRTGRIHPSFNQTGTETGRLSCSDPNLQNIPIRSEIGSRIRTAFVAQDGNVLISADYSQIELRILAHLSGDETMIAAFQADQDIHKIVAAEVFGVELDQVTPAQRARAKGVNFGIIYGQTAYGLSRALGISKTEAQEFINSYKRRFRRIEEFFSDCVARAKANGWAETIAGRRRKIEGFDSQNPQRRALAERLAINSVVQGSAADLIKIAMINIHRRIERENRPTKMLLQIHDELIFEAPYESVKEESEFIASEMANAFKLRVPLKVDIGIGANWRDAK